MEERQENRRLMQERHLEELTVTKATAHGMGLFARKELKDVNLGPYSYNLITGEQAAEVIANKNDTQQEYVEATVCPNWGDASDDFGPFILCPNNQKRLNDGSIAPDLRYINEYIDMGMPQNTVITETGDFHVTAAKKGEELLAFYGSWAQYPAEYREKHFNETTKQKGYNEITKEKASTTGVTDKWKNPKHTNVMEGGGTAGYKINDTCVSVNASMLGKREAMTLAREFVRSSQIDKTGESEVCAWIRRCRHEMKERDNNITLILRVALQLVMWENGSSLRCVKSQGKREGASGFDSCAYRDMVNDLVDRLGWTRKVQESGMTAIRMIATIKNDAAKGDVKSARNYAKCYLSRKAGQQGECSFVQLRLIAENQLRDMARHNIGHVHVKERGCIIHICAGSAPLSATIGGNNGPPLRGLGELYKLRIINVEKDRKPWHSEEGELEPTHMCRTMLDGHPEPNAIEFICRKAKVHTTDIDAIVVSTSCETTASITSIAPEGSRHRDANYRPLTKKAIEEEDEIEYIRDQVLNFCEEMAVRGRKVVWGFEQGEATCFVHRFMPHTGLSAELLGKTQTDQRFPAPIRTQWGCYGSSYKKRTVWVTNQRDLCLLGQNNASYPATIVRNKPKFAELQRTQARETELNVKEGKSKWPRLFGKHLFNQWRFQVNSMPMVNCGGVLQQQLVEGHCARAAREWHETQLREGGGSINDGRNIALAKAKYVQSLKRDIWVIAAEDHEWSFAQTVQVKWNTELHQYDVEYLCESGQRGVATEATLRKWKKAVVQEHIRDGKLTLEDGCVGSISKKRTERALNPSDNRNATFDRQRALTSDRGTLYFHKVTYANGESDDMFEYEMWNIIARVHAPEEWIQRAEEMAAEQAGHNERRRNVKPAQHRDVLCL